MTAVAVPLRFRIGARTLLSIPRRLVRVRATLEQVMAGSAPPLPPASGDGYLVASLPEAAPLPDAAGLVPPVRQRRRRYHADLWVGHEAWLAGMSGSARQSPGRKSRKLLADTRVTRHRTPAELDTFHPAGRAVSRLTYQERLLDAGLPDTPAFRAPAAARPGRDEVRAWLLWSGDRPVAYLYGAAEGSALRYDHVGHDPAWSDRSPGTVLHAEAMRDLFGERRFRWFDCTEGEGRHKPAFATGSTPCLDVLLLPPTLADAALSAGPAGFDGAVAAAKRWRVVACSRGRCDGCGAEANFTNFTRSRHACRRRGRRVRRARGFAPATGWQGAGRFGSSCGGANHPGPCRTALLVPAAPSDDLPPMHLRAEAIVLSVRPHGEHGAVVRALTHGHGVQPGYVRGGRSRRLRPVLQPGNLVLAGYRARTDEQLAALTVELAASRAALHAEPAAAAAIQWATALAAAALPEAQPYPRLYDALDGLLSAVEAAPSARGWTAALVRYELVVLAELGFGLDLDRCAATGTTDDLAFVSPRSAAAVSRGAARGYEDRLLALPPFVRGDGAADGPDLLAGLRLSGHFLARDVLTDRAAEVLAARDRLVDRLKRAVA